MTSSSLRCVISVTLASIAAPLCFCADNGISSDRLKLIPLRMQEAVEHGVISGAAALVAHNGKVAAFDAVGWSDIEKHKPMRTDTIVQIMSQTKSVTGVAAMMLVEEGKLDLSRPISVYLPEFRDQQIEDKQSVDGKTLRAPKHLPTVGQLMNHTAGFPFLPATGPYHRLNYTLDATLADAVSGFAHENLVSEPGTKYSYSNMGIATLGRIVEVLSGSLYQDFVMTRIIEPLGMKDTFFFPPADKQSRIAMVYTHEDGKLVLAREKAQGGDPAKYRAGVKYPGPELGLFSTASDLLRFYGMLAGGGVWENRRYLSAQSVKAMTQDYTPDKTGYGLTFSVRGQHSLLNLVSPGTFGHGGAFGTDGWVDPSNHLIVIFLGQMLDGTADPIKNAVGQLAEAAIQ